MLLRLVDSEYFTTHRHSLLVWFTECDDNSENQSSSTICIAGYSNRKIVFDRLHGYLYKLLMFKQMFSNQKYQMQIEREQRKNFE